MSVDPLKSNALAHADAGRTGSSSAARRSDASSVESQSEQPIAADSVQLSAASRSLVEATAEADRVPEGTLSPERMREVLRRLDQDQYSSAEVQDKVAHAVLRDLGLSRTE
jgi:hypothetical protein